MHLFPITIIHGAIFCESHPLSFPDAKWILVSLVEIKETSIRSFRQDKENYGDHFIIHYYISITLLCPFMQEECVLKYFVYRLPDALCATYIAMAVTPPLMTAVATAKEVMATIIEKTGDVEHNVDTSKYHKEYILRIELKTLSRWGAVVLTKNCK